jgi:tellurite resistance protein
MRLIVSIAVLAVSTLPALADRQVTEDERTKLVAAVQAEGCSGGKLEFDDDDQQFEVDDAVCADGKKYDLKFDAQMKLKRKNLD